MSKIPKYDPEELQKNRPGRPMRNPDVYFVMLLRVISSSKYGSDDAQRRLLSRWHIDPDSDTALREARRVWRQLHRQFETYWNTWSAIERILDAAGWEFIFLKDASRYWIRDTRKPDPVNRLGELRKLLRNAKDFKDYKACIKKKFVLMNEWGR